MEITGRHLLVELRGCDAAALDDLGRLEAAMRRAAQAAGATVVASVFHPFSPQGVTGVVVIEESHLSIHTWPEAGYAAVDLFTCGDCEPDRAVEVLREAVGACEVEVLRVTRGLPDGARRGIRVDEHEVDGREPKPGDSPAASLH